MGCFVKKRKFLVFEMWRLEWPTNVPKGVPQKSWCMKVLSWVGFAHHQVRRCVTTQVWWGILWKIEIRDFWGVKVGKAYKCPQINTINIFVNKSFEFCGFCSWPCLAVWHDKARLLGGVFCEKLKFFVVEMWRLECPPNAPNEYHESLCARNVRLGCVLHMALFSGIAR